MKIIFDANPMVADRTGIAYYTERLIIEMANKYPDVEFVGFYYNFLGRRKAPHLPKLHNLRYTGASLIPGKIVFELRRRGIEVPIELLARERADFVLYPNFLDYPSLFTTPGAPVIHDLTYIDLPEYVSAKLRKDLVRFVPRALKRSRFVVTVSEFSKQRIQEVYGTPPESIIVTPIPPTAPTYHDDAASELEKLGIKGRYILFVGTIEPRKNIPNLIKAYLQLPKDLQQSYKLVIAGRIGWNCEEEVSLLKQVQDAGENILHLGYVTDKAKDVLYANASLFTSASHYEGFGMPTLESMSYGVPCVLSDIPVFHEVAADTALYFDHTEPASITKALETLLTNKKELAQRAQAAKHRAVSAFSWESVAASLFEHIRAAVRK